MDVREVAATFTECFTVVKTVQQKEEVKENEQSS
jgi:hypothetical protein